MEKNKLNEELFDIIVKVARTIKRKIIFIPHADKFTILQIEVLKYLYQQKKTRNVDLAKYFQVTKSTASINLERLEKLKLIKYKQVKKDRRVNWISITPKGRSMLNKYLRKKQANINKLLLFYQKRKRGKF
jgi:DNA-binding MarR family transcriptional regulator